MVDYSKLKAITSKWPQCVVVGKKVSVDQAKAILRRTDDFFVSSFCGGNDEKYGNELRKRMGMPGYDISYDDWKRWTSEHGSLDLNHFNNSWINSCYVGGPNGWCHVDGTIHSAKNIGKWPSWEEVVEDLEVLGREFPFLDMHVYVMDDEYSEDERTCLGGLHLHDGEIDVVDGIDPSSDVCRNDEMFALFSGPSESLKNEVKSVVKKCDYSYFRESCPYEHIFRIEEALEYFNQD